MYILVFLQKLLTISPCPSPEHSNYFGADDKMGAVAVSIRREKLDDTKDLKDQYQYRIIVRTSEVWSSACVYFEDFRVMRHWWVSMSVHTRVNYLLSFTSLCVPTCSSPYPLCPCFNLPLHPRSRLCQWKIPPAQSQCSKAKPNTGCCG